MIRFVLFLAILALTCQSYAQKHEWKVPDYDSVKSVVMNKQSVYYYPKLLKRYIENDTTLATDEYFYLYYGYFYNKEEIEDYKKTEKLNDRIKEIMAKSNYNSDDYVEVIKLSQKYLATNPFDFRKIDLLYSTYTRLKDTVTAYPYLFKLRKLVRTILRSGDGRTDETGYHVIDVDDEYFILNVLGYDFESQALTKHPCDYMIVKSNKDKVEGVYFDVTQIFQSYNKMFTPELADKLLNESKSKKK